MEILGLVLRWNDTFFPIYSILKVIDTDSMSEEETRSYRFRGQVN